MKKFAVVLALLLSNISQAQEVVELTKKVKCSNTKVVMAEFMSKYQELPLWVSKTDSGTEVALLMNKEKKTWTLLEFNDTLACVIATGGGGSSPQVFY